MAGVPYMMNITASNVFGVGDAYSQQFFTRELGKYNEEEKKKGQILTIYS